MGSVYTVDYEWDPIARSWSALVEEQAGCHSQGRSLREAMASIREALELWLNLGPDEHLADTGVEVVDRPRVPGLDSEAARISTDREELERRSADLSERTRQAVGQLVASGISMRDAATILGVSHQRIGQLAGRRKR